MELSEMVELVKQHALENYECNGWDILVECYEDAQIAEIIVEAHADSAAKAIAAVGSILGMVDDYRQDIIASGF